MRTLAAAVLLFALCAPAAADPRADAQRLVAEATAAYDRGEYETALARYRDAQAVYPSANLNYNIALALEKLRRPLEALDAYRHFLDEAASAPDSARSHARERLTALDGTLARVTVATQPGVTVSVDQRDVGVTPLPSFLRLVAGRHTIKLAKTGFVTIEEPIDLAVGAREVFTRELTRKRDLRPDRVILTSPSPSPTDSLPPPRRGKTPLLKKPWFWGAVAAVAAASVVTVVLISQQDDAGFPASDLGNVHPFGD